jgi:hypothetical protein
MIGRTLAALGLEELNLGLWYLLLMPNVQMECICKLSWFRRESFKISAGHIVFCWISNPQAHNNILIWVGQVNSKFSPGKVDRLIYIVFLMLTLVFGRLGVPCFTMHKWT